MSNKQSERSVAGGRPGGASRNAPTFRGSSSRGPTVTRGTRGRSRQPLSPEEVERRRVWGFTPNSGNSSNGMALLLERQTQLKAALSRQAKLSKIAVAEVRSTEVEQLRMVNQALLDVSSSVPGSVNPFRHRNLTDAQLRAESMVRRQGKRFRSREPVSRKAAQPSPNALRVRRKLARQANVNNSQPYQARLEDCFSLRGVFARDFRRAKERGYRGSPSQWLGGPKSVQLYEKLTRTGLSCSPPERWDIFCPYSPLHWAVNSSSGMEEHNLRHGFQGERLRTKPTNFVVLRRQAASVKRLKLSDWPRDERGRSWPNLPTLNESWEMVQRGKTPLDNLSIERPNLIRNFKIPTKQVKPGSSVRAVSKYVLGVRADIEVPKGLLGYFAYRWGFLILKRSGPLPGKLVKSITRIWKEDISGLFLRCHVRYNDALRRLPPSTLWVLRGFVPGGQTGLVNKKSRARPNRNERHAKALPNRVRAGGSETSDRAPSSDKSDGGVRLY